MRNTSQKLLAVFATDIEKSFEDILQLFSRENFQLLALDNKGINHAESMNLKYSLIDDWISETDILNAKNEALYCTRNWYKRFQDAFTINNICMPYIDESGMQFFWNDICIAKKLTERLSENDVKEFAFFIQKRCLPKLFYFYSDSCGHYWKDKIESSRYIISHVKLRNQKTLPNFFRGLLRFIGREASNLIDQNNKRNILKILASFLDAEEVETCVQF